MPNLKGAANMKIIAVYASGCAVLLIAFLIGWVYNVFAKGTVDLKVLLEMFNALTDPQCVAAVTFVAVFSVDKDGNGISDAVEQKLEDKCEEKGEEEA